MPSEDFSWIPFYTEFAEKLLPYANDRKTLIAKIQAVYEAIGMKLPTLERGEWIDTDPFTVFGLFNKGIRKENRIAIIEGLAKEFSVRASVPSSFEGVPILNNQAASFYRFMDKRGEHDIDTLWHVFVDALAYAKDSTLENEQSLISSFDSALLLDGVCWTLTMGLFWIAPNTYINLDGRNRWFISNSPNPPQKLREVAGNLEDKKLTPKGSWYLHLSRACREVLESAFYPFANFAELSHYAWSVSEQVNEENRMAARIHEEEEEDLVRETGANETQYWIYSPGRVASKWDEFYREGVMAIEWGELGDLSQYATKEDIQKKLTEISDDELSYKGTAFLLSQFRYEMKPGDVVFVKKGKFTIIGKGVVTSEYMFDSSRTDEFKHIRKIEWTHKGEWEHPGHACTNILANINSYPEYVAKLNAFFEEVPTVQTESSALAPSLPRYTKADFLSEVFMTESRYEEIVDLLRYKKNLILQGAPGVGKTYCAKRLAYSMMGEKDEGRVMMVQFHQSTSYEDFMMGFRPTESGFELKKGPFYTFCKRAKEDGERDYFFVIDEINRGNLSKILGELFMLMESDKRGMELPLLYENEAFSVPPNVYIIGLMNTADRSLAMLDYALRRRFAFVELEPAFELEGFQEMVAESGIPKFKEIVDTIRRLNAAIESDDTLGRGFRIGHSYFCAPEAMRTESWLRMVVKSEILPLLEEYWFDDLSKVEHWTRTLRGVLG